MAIWHASRLTTCMALAVSFVQDASTIGPDKALYITDTATGRMYRLPAGATTAELYPEHPMLKGIDGITFLDGTLYVNNVIFNKLYRIPINAAWKGGQPVDIWMDQPAKGPDGMRAANGRLYLAENGRAKSLFSL